MYNKSFPPPCNTAAAQALHLDEYEQEQTYKKTSSYMLLEGMVGSGMQTHCERLVLSQRDTSA